MWECWHWAPGRSGSVWALVRLSSSHSPDRRHSVRPLAFARAPFVVVNSSDSCYWSVTDTDCTSREKHISSINMKLLILRESCGLLSWQNIISELLSELICREFSLEAARWLALYVVYWGILCMALKGYWSLNLTPQTLFTTKWNFRVIQKNRKNWD